MAKSYGAKGLSGDAKSWNDAAPEMSRQNAKRPMVVEQTPSGAIMGRSVTAKPTASRGMGKAQGAYINNGTVPMVKGKKKLEMCPDCGKPMFGGKCSCGDDMGKRMTKGMMCKCGSGMTKAMCKCGGMSKAISGTLGGGMGNLGTADMKHPTPIRTKPNIGESYTDANGQKQRYGQDHAFPGNGGMGGRQTKPYTGGGIGTSTDPAKGRGTIGPKPTGGGGLSYTGGSKTFNESANGGVPKRQPNWGGHDAPPNPLGGRITKPMGMGKAAGAKESCPDCGKKMTKGMMCKCGGMGKGAKTSMRKAMPVAQPNAMNSRPIANPGPMIPNPAKTMPKNPMPIGGTPGQSGRYGGINPNGMYGGKSARGSMRKADAGAYDAAFEDEMNNMPAPKPYPKSKKK
jgi:hypothetical protein